MSGGSVGDVAEGEVSARREGRGWDMSLVAHRSVGRSIEMPEASEPSLQGGAA